jgi:hypothetical protein
MQRKESPKIAHPYRCAQLVSFQNQFLHTFLSPFPSFGPELDVSTLLLAVQRSYPLLKQLHDLGRLLTYSL